MDKGLWRLGVAGPERPLLKRLFIYICNNTIVCRYTRRNSDFPKKHSLNRKTRNLRQKPQKAPILVSFFQFAACRAFNFTVSRKNLTQLVDSLTSFNCGNNQFCRLINSWQVTGYNPPKRPILSNFCQIWQHLGDNFFMKWSNSDSAPKIT